MATELIHATTGEGQRAEVNGVSLYYDESGEGFPLLLLHGGIMDHQSWGNQIPALRDHFRVIAPDTRGHGRSSDTDQPFSYALFADDCVALCKELGITRAHFVGFSDGACTAMILGKEHPELVERLVVIGTPYNTSNYPEGTVEQFGDLTPESLIEAVGPEFAEVIRKAEAQYPTDAAWRAFFAKLVQGMWTREPNFRLGDLADIEAPTLVLHAEREPFFSLEHSEAIARTVQHGQLRVVPASTHTSPQENPGFVNETIVNFLSGDNG